MCIIYRQPPVFVHHPQQAPRCALALAAAAAPADHPPSGRQQHHHVSHDQKIRQKLVLQRHFRLESNTFQGFGEHIKNLWLQNNQ